MSPHQSTGLVITRIVSSSRVPCTARPSVRGAGYASVECAPECSVVERSLVLCETDDDCAGAIALRRCLPSRIVPNLKVCVPF